MTYTFLFFNKKKVYKKVSLKWPTSLENDKAQFSKFSIFVGQKSILRHYHIQSVEDGVQIRVYTINKESVTYFSQFISVKFKTLLRISQTQFREKFRKGLGKMMAFLSKNVYILALIC